MKYEFIKNIDLFSGLPEEDLKRLCEMVEEVHLEAGEELFAEGSTGNEAYIIHLGELDILKNSAGTQVQLAVRGPGEVIGEIALLDDTSRTASVRARTDSALYKISKEQFDHLLATSLSASRVMFYTILGRWKETQGALRQSEKLAALGKLTAGIAHELNNPAAAVQRGADQLEQIIEDLLQAQIELEHLHVSEPQEQILEAFIERARFRAEDPQKIDTITRSDQEEVLENWMQAHQVDNSWVFAPTLVTFGLQVHDLDRLLQHFDEESLPAIIHFLHARCNVANLLAEVGHGSKRISEIVKSLKNYTYMDQGPVQEVDINAGLESTLVILRHKLKYGITLKRDFDPNLPKIQGRGGELNQVWTNLLDNAIDSVDETQGNITVRTRREEDWVVVEIEDDGPGIPDDIMPRLFDPFFTTKAPGSGTGMGLDISRNIITNRHGGNIQVFSQPGRTCFQVSLPVNFAVRG
jgi:signal transduction histidine kinase